MRRGVSNVLVTAELPRGVLENVFNGVNFQYDGYSLNHEVMPHNELERKIRGVDVLICEYDTIDAEIMAAASDLKLIICCRGGVKSVVDIDYAAAHGILVCNTAGRNANSVADIILGYILDLTRNITLTNSLMHSGSLTGYDTTKPKEYRDVVWGLDNESPFIRYRGRSINHMVLGIVGYGCAGKTLAQKATALGLSVIAYSPHLHIKNIPSYIAPVSFERLISDADIVSVNCALNNETRDMFNAEVFSKMKKGSYFINTARGEVVVEADLIAALKSHRLAGAALDVTREEPLPKDSPLIGVENLILTPHIGGSSDDVQKQGIEMVVRSLSSYIEGDRPYNCVV